MKIVLLAIPLLALATWSLQGRSQNNFTRSLAGHHAGLTWQVLQTTADTLEPPQTQAGQVRFIWPKQAKLLGSKWLPPTVRVGFRVNAPLQKVFENRHKQLLAQGFVPLEQQLNERDAHATYRRTDGTITLMVQRLGPDTYRSDFSLNAVP